MIRVDRASFGLGQAHQQGLCKDLDYILACKHLHIHSACVLFLFLFFYFIVVALTSSLCASLTLTLAVHLSIATVVYSSHIFIILSPFSSLLI